MPHDCEERQAIVDVLIRYATCLDSRDLAGLSAVFEKAAVADYDGYVVEGLDAIVRGVSSTLDHCGPTQHLLSNFVVHLSRDAAETVCAARIVHTGRGERAALQPFEVLGEYRDVLRRTADGWRIARRGFTERMRFGDAGVVAPW